MTPDLRPSLPPVRWVAAPADRALVDALGAGGRLAVAILLPAPAAPGPEHQETAAALGGDLEAVAGAYVMPANRAAVTRIPLPRGLLLLVHAGDGSATDVRLAAAAAARAAGTDTALVIALGPGQAGDAAVEGVLLGGHRQPTWTGSGPQRKPGLREVVLGGGSSAEEVARGRVRAAATLLARNLANAPSNVKNPPSLAAWAGDLAADGGLSVRVWDEKALAREGFGGLIAVGQGSHTPPRLVQLTHAPRGADRRPIVLVGKGITFDTGGLDIKPAAGMLPMKTDMSGAAIVLAVLASCRALGISRRVVGLMPLAENAIGGNSYRPSDVITQYGGRTVEIGNTDAEGRLVLADALSYAATRLDPAAIVDIATLTGHARIALAGAMAPSYATDADVHTAVAAACALEGEPVWQMPLVDDYRASLDSHVADLSHIGPLGGANAGSILAALFLREFVGDVPWVHLDIAGTGRSESDTGLLAAGATGYGARGLLRWLEGA